MSAAAPSAGEERWYELSRQLAASVDPAVFTGRLGGWRRARLPTRCALFVAALLAAGFAHAVLQLLHIPHAVACIGAIELALAEWLIRRRRLFACGVEEALAISGLLSLGYDLLLSHSGFATGPIIWLITGAFGAAALRLRNALFGLVAALVGVGALVYYGGVHTPWLDQHGARIASLLCYAFALVALGAGARTLSRPSHERMLDWLVVAMPVAGYLWSASSPNGYFAADYLHDHSPSALYTPLAPLLFGVIALFTGLRRRTHAPVLAGMLCVACVAYELRNLSGLPWHVRFMLWGTLLLATAVVLERWLRRPRGGITSRRLGPASETDGLLQLGGAAALTPPAAPAANATFSGGGGGFGGGGASGRY